MTLWKISTTAALVSLVFAGSAFAQATTGTEMKAEGKKMRKMMAAGDEKVKAAQQALKDKGYDAGAVDGRMGPKTQAALRDFQKAQGMESTGDLDPKTTQALGMDVVGATSSADASSTAGSASPATESSSTESPITVSGAATGEK